MSHFAYCESLMRSSGCGYAASSFTVFVPTGAFIRTMDLTIAYLKRFVILVSNKFTFSAMHRLSSSIFCFLFLPARGIGFWSYIRLLEPHSQDDGTKRLLLFYSRQSGWFEFDLLDSSNPLLSLASANSLR